MSMPRVWDGTAYTRPLHPSAMSVSLNLTPLSTANLTLPPEDTIAPLEWVQIETPDGEVGEYRVVSVDSDMRTGYQSVYLEHGACVLGDYVITNGAGKTDKITKKDTIANILGYIVLFQDRWGVGTVEAEETIYIDLGGMTLLNAVTTIMESIPGYYLQFTQDENDGWLIHIKARSTTPVCEARLSRNLESCSISYDTQNIVTRVWAENITGGKMDSQNVATYGLREQTLSLNDSLTKAQRETIAAAYLEAHDHPTLNVSISAVELSQVTGLDIDKFVLGTVCRVAVPWLNVTETETIISKSYGDLLNAPHEVSITLAYAKPDLSIMVAQTASSGGAAANKAEKEYKRFEIKTEQDDEKFRRIATDSQWEQMGEGTDPVQKVTAYSQILQTASAIQSVVSRSGYTTDAIFLPESYYVAGDIVMYGGKMYEFNAAHHGDWTGADVTQITNMYSSITQSESNITTLVSKTGIDSLGQSETLYSKISQNAENITLKVSKGDVGTQLALDVNNVTISGGGLVVDGMITAADLSAGTISAIDIGTGEIDGGTADFSTILGTNIQGAHFLIEDSGGEDLVNGIKGVRIVPISGTDNYKLQYSCFGTYGTDNWQDAGTFSRAASSITLSGAWSGGDTFTVSPTPQSAGSPFVETVTYNIYPTPSGGASSTTIDTFSSSTYRASIAIGSSNVSGGVVKQFVIDASDVYDDGYTDGEMAMLSMYDVISAGKLSSGTVTASGSNVTIPLSIVIGDDLADPPVTKTNNSKSVTANIAGVLYPDTATITTTAHQMTPPIGYAGFSSVVIPAINLQDDTFYSNGQYLVPSNKDGYGTINVSVSASVSSTSYMSARAGQSAVDAFIAGATAVTSAAVSKDGAYSTYYKFSVSIPGGATNYYYFHT